MSEEKLIYLKPEELYPHPDNPRLDIGDIAELVESVKANGILQNLTVIPGRKGTPEEIAHRTASGEPMVVGDTVAVGHLPFGTKIMINDHVYTVTDRGVTGHHVDILFSSHGEAKQFGVQYAEVFIKR